MGPALQAAFMVMSPIGGKLLLFQSAVPSLGKHCSSPLCSGQQDFLEHPYVPLLAARSENELVALSRCCRQMPHVNGHMMCAWSPSSA